MDKFFANKYVKLVESGLLVGAAYVLVTKLGLPNEIVSPAILSLAGVLGLDGIATAISTFKTTKKEDQKEDKKEE